MCLPPAGTGSQAMSAMRSAKPADARRAQGFMNMAAISDPSYVRSVYDKEGSSGFERTFGAYDGGPQNPFGGAAYRQLAKTQNREFDPSDLYGEKAAATAKEAALNERLAAIERQQADYNRNRARLGTISTGQTAKVKTPSTANRTPVRLKPIRTSLKTSYGTKQIPSAMSSKAGVNVPN